MHHKVIVSSIEENVDLKKPEDFSLIQNYPNSFNSTPVIPFSVAKESKIKITVYNILGQEVATIINDNLNAGSHEMGCFELFIRCLYMQIESWKLYQID